MKDKKNNNQFLRIDFSILKINEIIVSGKKEKFSASAKQLYCYLLNWPEAFPSHNKIAEVFGITRKAAEKQIKKLIELGLIERVSRPGSSNLYRVLPITEEMRTGRSYSENKGTKFEQLPVEICEAMPEQEPRIEAALPLGNNEQPDKDEHAMVLQPAKEHEPAAVRPPNTPERDRDMDLDLDELLEPQEDREKEYAYRVTRTPVPIPATINPDDPDSWDEDSLPF